VRSSGRKYSPKGVAKRLDFRINDNAIRLEVRSVGHKLSLQRKLADLAQSSRDVINIGPILVRLQMVVVGSQQTSDAAGAIDWQPLFRQVTQTMELFYFVRKYTRRSAFITRFETRNFSAFKVTIAKSAVKQIKGVW
jgi:hypothetical protein